ncbi:MAG: transcription termination factor NusA [Rhodobacteraceae bacterium]|nr:transcription termination factor NusA [Paracoccaceae bacterium]MCY4195806.1 transcription termination factor NusA [Paracoccaceae bacterium]MCY4327747.1 transcription termination factor NusA [Paracoccaceae bacterium]
MTIAGANKLELVQIAESVAQEKMIDRSLVIEAIEDSLGKAARMKYGIDRDIRVSVDPDTGDQTVMRVHTVVEEVEDNNIEISVEDARKQNPDAQIGDEIKEPLEPFDMNRILATTSKQVLLQKVREAERERQYEEFKDRVGTVIVGTVKREEFGNIIVDLTRGEAILRRDQKIGRESYGNGERLRAYITEVRKETRGPQIFLSRSANEFMVELFRSEVPEIYDNLIEIRRVARDPGSRAKIAVASKETSVDPVGACVGMRGSRVQAVVNELQGERIDVIPWTDNPVDFIVSSLQPARVSKVMLDENGIPTQVVVPDEQLSLAIGRRGQNVRLACELTGFDITIITETKEMENRQAEFAKMTEDLMSALEIDEVFAQHLVAEGFDQVEALATSSLEELAGLDGIDNEIAETLKSRAQEFVDEENEELMRQAREYGLEDDLAEFAYLSPRMLFALASAEGDKKVTSLSEFASCDMYELVGEYIVVNNRKRWEKGLLEDCDITLEEARQLIIRARLAAGLLQPEEAEELLRKDEDPTQIFEVA